MADIWQSILCGKIVLLVHRLSNTFYYRYLDFVHWVAPSFERGLFQGAIFMQVGLGTQPNKNRSLGQSPLGGRGEQNVQSPVLLSEF